MKPLTFLPSLGALAIAAPANAATVILPDSGDTGWLIAAALIGLIAAVPGALLYLAGGAARDSGQRIAVAAMSGGALATLLYLVIGYSFIFDATPDLTIGRFLGGNTNWMLNMMGMVRDGTTVPETAFVLFHLVFVLLAVALLSGALAPRARPGWLLGFTGLWLLIVLAPILRWMWGGGWLAAFGALDIAGGLVIFYAAAVSAIIALALVGAPQDEQPMPGGDNMRLAGAALLTAGMAALSGGATLGAGDGTAVAALTVLIAAATGALAFSAMRRRIDAATLAGGLMAGTVSVAAAGDSVAFGGAVLIAGLAAAALAITPRVMHRFWHDRGAAMGGIAAAAKTGGLLFGLFLAFQPFGGSGYAEGTTMAGQLLAQLVAILAIAGWSVIGTIIAALMVGLVLPMRSTALRIGETGTES